MPARVYEVKEADRERLARDLAEDRISRLSIQLREARHFGLDRDTIFAVLEGEEAVLLDADARILAYGREPDEKENVLGWVRWEDEASAYGLGHVMGPVEFREHVRPPPPPLWKRAWRWLLGR